MAEWDGRQSKRSGAPKKNSGRSPETTVQIDTGCLACSIPQQRLNRVTHPGWDLWDSWLLWQRKYRTEPWSREQLQADGEALRVDLQALQGLLSQMPAEWTVSHWDEMYRRSRRWAGRLLAIQQAIAGSTSACG